MAKPIGIDLGTTNSVVAIMEGDQPKVLVNAQGSASPPRSSPSPIKAKSWSASPPRPTGYQSKKYHLLHQALHGPPPQRSGQEEKMVPYEIIGGPEEMVKVKVRGKNTPPSRSRP